MIHRLVWLVIYIFSSSPISAAALTMQIFQNNIYTPVVLLPIGPSATNGGILGSGVGRMLCMRGTTTSCRFLGAELSAVSTTCEVNGEAVSRFPIDYHGIRINAYWGGVHGSTDYDVLINHPFAVGSDNPYIIVSFAWGGGNYAYVGPETVSVVCRHDFSGVGELRDTVGGVVESGVWTNRVTANVENNYGFTVVQPRRIYGRINEKFWSPFDITSEGGAAEVSWSIGEPCASWHPSLYLAVTPGERIEPGTEDTLLLGLGINTLVAQFTPNTSGEFTCVATLTATRQ